MLFLSRHHLSRHIRPSLYRSFSTTPTPPSTTPSTPNHPLDTPPLHSLPPVLTDDTMDSSDSLRRVGRLARPEASLIAKSVATLGITSSITLLIPSACGQVIDICINDPTGFSPYYAAGGLLSLTAIAGGGVVLRSRWLAIAGNRIVARMRRQLFNATLSQDIAFFDRVPTGDLVTRLAADTQMIQRAATVQVVAAMRSLIMGAGGTACLMYVFVVGLDFFFYIGCSVWHTQGKEEIVPMLTFFFSFFLFLFQVHLTSTGTGIVGYIATDFISSPIFWSSDPGSTKACARITVRIHHRSRRNLFQCEDGASICSRKTRSSAVQPQSATDVQRSSGSRDGTSMV